MFGTHVRQCVIAGYAHDVMCNRRKRALSENVTGEIGPMAVEFTPGLLKGRIWPFYLALHR